MRRKVLDEGGDDPLPLAGSLAKSGQDRVVEIEEDRLGQLAHDEPYSFLTTASNGSYGCQPGIRLLEHADILRQVVFPLEERLRIPFAAGHGKKVAAIDVDRPGQTRQRIGHRVDDVTSERLDLPLAQRPGACG